MNDIMIYVDFISLIVSVAVVSLLGFMDLKYRGVPAFLLLLFIFCGIVFTLFRFVYGDVNTRTVTQVSILVNSVLALSMLILSQRTHMIGLGDVLVIIATAFTSPYPPIGNFVRLFPSVIPISTVLSALLIYIRQQKTTIYMKNFPPRYRRVLVRRAAELKKKEIVTEYPIYIEGAGFVYDKVFNGTDPVENTKRLVEKLPNTAIVYTIPNYPFVYYFAIAYGLTMACTIAIGLGETVGVF